jgi:hypothetical protein
LSQGNGYAYRLSKQMCGLMFAFLFVLLPFGISAQLETTADWKRQVYEKEFTGGVMFHTRGYGVNFRSLKFKDGFIKKGFDFDFVLIRHPKEVKFPSQISFNSARSYVYGKINGFYNLRVGYGRDKILVDKTDRGSISISWLTFGGLSMGILKPIYLEILKETPQGIPVLSTERYDPEIHNFLNIYGQAPFFTGIEKSSLRMGVYVKTGFAFDYNWNDAKVTTLEVGAIVDYFPQWFGLYSERLVPIMVDTENFNVWLQFYFTVNFGKKWN